MGHRKAKWTSDELKALIAGVEKYGIGRWSDILRDPDLSPFLDQRSNINLKDKWRNFLNSPGQVSREKSTNSNGNTESSASNSLVVDSSSSDTSMNDDLPNNQQDVYNVQWYNDMIFEALSALGSINMPDHSAICNFIEQRNESPLPTNFKRALDTRLRSLIGQGKLEKVQNGYRIMAETQLGSPTKTPTFEHKEFKPQEPQKTSSLEPTPQEAEADKAAKLIAKAEYLSILANVALKTAESISYMAEESKAMVELANDIYVRCCEGEIIFLSDCQ